MSGKTNRYIIKRLQSDDIAVMRQVNALFADVFNAADDYPEGQPDDVTLAKRLANPNIIALAAIVSGDVIGGLTGYILPKLEQSRSEIYIYDLAVAEGWWRNGIATDLIEALKNIARECGAWMIFVQADHGDDPAIALYTKLGMREDVLHFDIKPTEIKRINNDQ